MDDGFDSKIKEIGGMLGIDYIPDGIGDIIGSFLNGNEKPASPVSCDTTDPSAMLAMVSKIKQIQETNHNDDKVKLLKALRPFLGKQRRQKVDQCVNIMMLKEIAPLIGK